MNLSNHVKLTQAITPTAGMAATSDINGATLDMSGFEGVLIKVTFGAITASAVTSIKAQQGADSGLSDAADLLGTGQTIADSDDDKIFWLDLYRPEERYVRLVVDRATQNAVVTDATYIQYGSRKLVPTHGTGIGGGELHVSPIEGTA